ncbi:hypothetical protein EON66_11015 [archaeon]|nr:MAG: hypothetical protein EON66_11015 [archaeon]
MVCAQAVRLCSHSPTPGLHPAAAAAGIQEWSNAIFLFVNLGEDSSNEFLEGGSQIVWYAQNRQTMDSAQIHRLIHHATGCWYPPLDATGATTTLPASDITMHEAHTSRDEAGDVKPMSPREGASNAVRHAVDEDGDARNAAAARVQLAPCDVCLICRLGTDPYVWCGRLTYVSHDATRHPIKFIWRLADVDELRARRESLYPTLLRAAGGAPSGSDNDATA